MEKEETQEKDYVVYTIGRTGVGKSFLANILLCNKQGCPHNGYDCTQVFRTNYGNSSVTGSIISHTVRFEEGQAYPNSPPFSLTVKDTPGLADTNGQTQKYIDQIITDIKGSNVNMIFFVFEASNIRLTSEMKAILKVFSKCLGELPEQSIGIIINKPPNVYLEYLEKGLKSLPQAKQEKAQNINVEICNLISTIQKVFNMQINPFPVFIGDEDPGMPNILSAIRKKIKTTKQIEVPNFKTWTELEQEINKNLSGVITKEEMLANMIKDLQSKISAAENNIQSYKKHQITAYAVAGGCVGALVFGVAGFGIATIGVGAVVATETLGLAVLGWTSTMYLDIITGLILFSSAEAKDKAISKEQDDIKEKEKKISDLSTDKSKIEEESKAIQDQLFELRETMKILGPQE